MRKPNMAKLLDSNAVKIARSKVKSGATSINDFVGEKWEDGQESLAPLSGDNWYIRTAEACDDIRDAMLNRKSGYSEKVAKAVIGKLGFVGAPAAIFSIAALLGTASTGTAIGTLSGAAFNSAALAWVGGSVVAGGVILSFAALAGGLGAAAGAGVVIKKYLSGEAIELDDLPATERDIVEACLGLSVALRSQDLIDSNIDPAVIDELQNQALAPLSDRLLERKITTQSWSLLRRRKFVSAHEKLLMCLSFLKSAPRRDRSIVIGITSAVLMKLMSSETPTFDQNEQFVLDALRRSKNSLSEASDEELANYVQSLSPEQLKGVSNNIKGIAHELRFAFEENADGDNYTVEIFEETNHAGSDIRLINTETGEVEEFQLKATAFRSYVEEHMEKYGDISVLATTEVANDAQDIGSSGISNEELKSDVETVTEGLSDLGTNSVVNSMALAGLITMARNTHALLNGGGLGTISKKEIVEAGVKSALVSGVVHVLIS